MKVFLSAFVLVLFSCSPAKRNDEKSDTGLAISPDTAGVQYPDTAIAKTLNDSLEIPGYYQNLINPVVFVNRAAFYKPGDSIPAGYLRFGQSLNIYAPDGYWSGRYKFKMGKDTFEISASDFTSHTFTTPGFRYFVMNYLSSRSEEVNGFRIYKYSLSQSRFIDTFYVDSARADLIVRFDPSSWKNVDLLIKVTEINACCGCTNYQRYFADVSGRFISLLQCSDFADDGGGGSYTISATLPEDARRGFVIKHFHSQDPVYNDLSKLEESGQDAVPDSIIEVNTTTWFRWNGDSLEMVEKPDNKQ